jgi:hypothetical protein
MTAAHGLSVLVTAVPVDHVGGVCRLWIVIRFPTLPLPERRKKRR